MTTIVGPTNCGKTAVMRSLVWVIRNKPTGKAFVRHGEEVAKAKLRLAGGHVVERFRSKDDNCYTVDGDVLRAMAADVPEKVTNTLRIAEASIQQQHDAPYMLGLSPRGLAEEINRITGCDDVDATLEASRTLLRESKGVTKVRKADLASATQALATTQPTEAFESTLRECELKHTKMQELTAGIDDLDAILAELPEEPREFECDFAPFEDLISKLDEIKKDGKQLADLLADLNDLPEAAECELPEGANQLSLDLQKLNDEIRSLSATLNESAAIESDLRSATATKEKAESEFAEMKKQGCPLCGASNDRDS